MAYSAKAVANFFLDTAWSEGEQLTPMKIQKLVYYAHGWSLGLLDEPLINEQVEAWKFGPVIKSLYTAFRTYGDSPITEPAVKRDVTSFEPLKIKTEVPKIDFSKGDTRLRPLLDRVWEVYKGFSAIQLSRMTHEPGSPWDAVAKRHNGEPPKGTDIPIENIRDHFKKLAAD